MTTLVIIECDNHPIKIERLEAIEVTEPNNASGGALTSHRVTPIMERLAVGQKFSTHVWEGSSLLISEAPYHKGG